MTDENLPKLCEDCADDEAVQYCEDCVSGSQFYCNDCAVHHLKKKANANHRIKGIGESADDNPSFEEFLRNLGFSKYFFDNEKLSLTDALLICNKNYNTTETLQPKELLSLILQKIMACNYQCRNVLLRNKTGQEPYPIICHPMDSLLAILLCCDNILLQDVYSRMHACQIAVPLLIPNPVKEKITSPLWAMRNIVKQWKYRNADNKYIPCEGRLVDCRLPIVSFMRLSKAKNLYKSKILNGVISDSKHPYFFDCECPGSGTKRLYIDGLVEVAWFLSQGSESDLFPLPITFCNLRGDSQNHLAQLKILMAISQVCFLFVKNDDIDMNLMDILSQFHHSQKKVYLLMNTSCRKEVSTKNCSVLTLRNKELPEVTEIIRHKINEALSELSIPHDLTTLSSAISASYSENKADIIIDEFQDEFLLLGKKKADELMKLVQDKKKKELLVPLQGVNYWQAWAKENKKQKRKQLADMGEMSQSEFFKKQKNLKKKMQKMLETGYSDAMKIFIDTLVSLPKMCRLYFLHWLKLQRDDYSRKVLPEMREKCASTRAMLAKIEKSKSDQTQTESKLKLQKRLHEENQELTNASFGLEHFFREMGVIYEIMSDTKSALHKVPWPQVHDFPKIAVELLLAGHALELLDGDAAHIPISWVEAILEEPKKTVGGKPQSKRLFVLSVLGIQSTGKSTLLNTAFGLRFAVSAGRCTRGAFFQLLKCDSTSFKGACDYMLVIDTEGLRAPELEYKGTQKHDNELATLVIGLASLTIVNVYGEVSGEMDDILQTTVHAFLRMTQADLRPSCLLVKHHVDEVTANKGMEGLLKLQNKLDEMALSAAREEHCEGSYQKFNDVIRFNIEKDVHYFPNLWSGTPPMSPVNPKYSEAAQKLKMKVIDIIADCSYATKSGISLLSTLAEFQLRIKKLWSSVLAENFIFSFKNTLEIAAFNELDQLSAKWSWSLESCVESWELRTRTLIKGGKLQTSHDEQKQIKEVEAELDQVHERIQQEIKDLFEKHEFAYALSHMRSIPEVKFRKFVENHKQNALKFCKKSIDREKLNLKVKNETQYRGKIQHAVKELVASMSIAKDTRMTDQFMRELNDQFSIKWNEWMREIEKDASPLHKADIQEEILQTIYINCGIESLHTLIRKGVEFKSLSARAKAIYLHLDVDETKHVNYVGDTYDIRISVFKKYMQRFIWGDNHCQMYSIIKQRTQEILQCQKQILDDICQNADEYNVRSIITIVSSVQKEIDQLQEEVKQCFTFTSQFRVDVILVTCGYAMRVFEDLQKKSHDNHPITYFKSKEENYRRIFLSLCRQEVQEKADAIQNAIDAAYNLTNVVMDSISYQLKAQMALTLERKEHDRMIFQTKKSLKREILLRLLRERDFHLYTTHLENIELSYLNWIIKFVHEHCESIGKDGKTLIVTIAADELKTMELAVENAVQKHYNVPASQSNEQWLNAFHQELKDLSIREEELMAFVYFENIELERFKKEFLVRFKQQSGKFYSEVCSNQSIFGEVKQFVSDRIHKRRAGCCAQCPFCKEQCEMSEPSHNGKHMCTIHRPQCLGGWCFTKSQEMALDICNDDIRGNRTFYFREAKEYVPFKDYQKYFKDWFIDEDRCHTPRYWQWFIGEYTTELAEHFRMKEPVKEKQMVVDWKNFSIDDAKADVEEKYKNYEE